MLTTPNGKRIDLVGIKRMNTNMVWSAFHIYEPPSAHGNFNNNVSECESEYALIL